MVETSTPAPVAGSTDNPDAMLVQASAQASARSFSGGGKVNLYGRYDIDLARPLREFEHEYAEAYECSGEKGLNDCMAFVLKDRFPVRQDIINFSIQKAIPGMVELRSTGIAKWPGDNRTRFILIYRRPPGISLMPRATLRRDPLSEEIVRRNIIRPIFYALQGFAQRGKFHGNIRPDNIFFNANEATAEAVLGECASSIPGILQQAIFETIERGMADKDGKGVGTDQDDIYSFGATVAVLMRGHVPLEGRNDRTVLEEKINRSSYSFFTDGLRLSPGISEFLRATLNDDPKQRWTMEQLASWIDGNRMTPKQTALVQKAQRTIDFNGRKYIRPKMLAKDLYENIPEAVELIESGNLLRWIERALGDIERTDALNEAIARAGGSGHSQGYDDRLVCLVCMALDPRAPIHYKGVSVMPAGLGYSMANAMAAGRTIQPHAELIRERYAFSWLTAKEGTDLENSDLARVFDQASKIIVRRGINFGLERCLYTLCGDAPCLSDLLQDYYVQNCNNLIQALDELAERSTDSKPLDRHISSFIAARDGHDSSGLMAIIEGNDKVKGSLAMLTLFQGLQKRSDGQKLPGLCAWLARDAEFVTTRLNNQIMKKDIIKQLPREIKTGSLQRVLMLIDNPMQVRQDSESFIHAVRRHRALGAESEQIRKELNKGGRFGENLGQHMAMVISAILAIAVIGLEILFFYLDKNHG